MAHDSRPCRSVDPFGSKFDTKSLICSMINRLAFLSALLLAVFAWIAPATALDNAVTDPAARQIAVFDDTLLSAMKGANQLGVSGRYRLLKPVLERTFDFPAMIATAVGPAFNSLAPADQKALASAFEKMTIATYAHDFDGYSGERFTISPNVAVRGDHKLVQTSLITPTETHAFNYVMHAVGGRWMVIDILLEGYVSQMATKRSEYAATVGQGGAAALVTKLNAISDGLLAARQR